MEELSPFQKALSVNRDRYNARFRLARHRSGNLDANAFLTHLRDFVGPVVDKAGGDPVEVTDALIDLSLATHGKLPADLHRVLLSQARFVAMDPRRVTVALANALHHLEAAPSASPHVWARNLEYHSRKLQTVESLLDLGAVLAWTAGVAALRDSALDVAERISPRTLRAITGTTDIGPLRADPWWTVTRKGLRVVRRLGTFRGFGGTFVKPPTVFLSQGRLHATDGDHTWRVHADRFGGMLRRAPHTQPEHQPPTLTLSPDGAVSGEVTVPELAGATSWVSWSNTLAATTPWTHAIIFVARS